MYIYIWFRPYIYGSGQPYTCVYMILASCWAPVRLLWHLDAIFITAPSLRCKRCF